ncbi:hypothetical protein WA1_00625 [Scytonema hofmannii PCC 7110]|uniref:Uncharacterized protein n=1 Tax=Scytonema hofmannii PCC 7110 TaxID=128403 RepID=A0A139XG83_9CYAN|nr:hypothetical protein [Scytonema hofmannii]KYC43706.1 hypothetical protein WA1_00625 [Scytonema hofmannii PCC 7110]
MCWHKFDEYYPNSRNKVFDGQNVVAKSLSIQILDRWPQKIGILGTIFGSLLIGISAIPQAAVAQQPTSKVNPCPSIFYEEPHNNRVLVPQGCPPNAATQKLSGQGVVVVQPGIVVKPGGLPVNRQPIPYPESRQEPIATVTPTAGTVDVRLKNNTNARVTYQAIAHTQPRILPGGEEIVLQDLPTPVTITMVREDGGLLKVMPVSKSDSGALAVSLDEETTLDNNQGVLRIQRDGQVYLN